MKRHSIAIVIAFATALPLATPAATLAQSNDGITVPSLPNPPIRSVVTQLTTLPSPAREVTALNGRYRTPQNVEPYGVLDQNNVRDSIYRDPMHCNMNGLLTPGQMNAAQQACSDRFYHVDHSG